RVTRPPELVPEVLERHRLVVRVDRERLAEDRLEPHVLPPIERDVGLEEVLERLRLDLGQVRNVDDRVERTELLDFHVTPRGTPPSAEAGSNGTDRRERAQTRPGGMDGRGPFPLDRGSGMNAARRRTTASPTSTP